MKKSLPTAFLILGLLTVLFAKSAFAHALWVEKDTQGHAGVCFGEYGEGLREKSGGKLDSISHLEAWSVGAEEKKTILAAQKTEDRFSLASTEKNLLAQDIQLPVKDMTKYKAGIAKPHLYARFSGSALSDPDPVLRLDILPAGAVGAFQVFFEEKPLADEKAVVIAPNGWTREFKTDKEGKFKAELLWPGLYVVEVTHIVEKAGNFEGKNYENERHRATLSIEKA